MNLEKDEKKEAKSYCTDSSCCSSIQRDEEQSAPSYSTKYRLTSKIKAIIFIIVMLAAVGVAAMSVFKKDRVESIVEIDDKYKTNIALQKPCGSSLDSLNSLNKVAVDKDFLFVLLPGSKAEETEKAAGIIEKTSEIIYRRGISVATFTMKTDSPDYQKLIGSYGIDGFPAVLAIRKGSGKDIVMGEITEEKLLTALLRASKPVSNKSSPCCPKKTSPCCPD